MQVTEKAGKIPALVTVEDHLFERHEEMTDTDGSLLVLLAGGKGVRRKISLPSRPECIHSLTGLRKLWVKVD